MGILSALLAPFDEETFKRDYITYRSLYVPGELEKIEKVFGFYPDRKWVAAHIREDALRENKRITPMGFLMDQHTSSEEGPFVDTPELRLQLSHSTLLTLYEDGLSTMLTNTFGFENCAPILRERTRDLLRDVGAPADDILQWFYTPGAGGASKGKSLHFDSGCTFVLQLEGTRRYYMAKETAVRTPGYFGFLAQDGTVRRRDYDVGWRADGDILKVDPSQLLSDNFYTVDLTPGDFLYFPGGCLHQTAYPVPGPSMSIAFGIRYLNTVDFVRYLLDDAFTDKGAWKFPCVDRNALDVSNLRDRVSEACEYLSAIAGSEETLALQRARLCTRAPIEAVGEQVIDDETWDPTTTVFIQPPGAILTSAKQSSDLLVLFMGDLEVEFDASYQPYWPAFSAMCRKKSFTGQQFVDWGNNLSWDGVRTILSNLASAGLLVVRTMD